MHAQMGGWGGATTKDCLSWNHGFLLLLAELFYPSKESCKICASKGIFCVHVQDLARIACIKSCWWKHGWKTASEENEQVRKNS